MDFFLFFLLFSSPSSLNRCSGKVCDFVKINLKKVKSQNRKHSDLLARVDTNSAQLFCMLYLYIYIYAGSRSNSDLRGKTVCFLVLFCFLHLFPMWLLVYFQQTRSTQSTLLLLHHWPVTFELINHHSSSIIFLFIFFFRHNQTFFRSFHAPRLLFCFVFVNSLSRVTSRRHLYTRTAATESVDRNRCPFLGRGNKKQEKKKKVERTFLNFYRQCETEGPCHTLWKMNGVDLRDYVYIHYVSNVAKYTERQISW